MAFAGQWGSDAQLCVTMKSSAAIEKWKYVTIASQSDGEIVQCSSAGEIALGIAQNKATAAGESVKVCVFGISKCIAGAAVTKGDTLQADGDGECIAATTSDEVMGMALEAADAADDVITVTVGYAGIF
jgi:hypothetical protein